MPWALLLTVGGLFLLVGLWKFVAIAGFAHEYWSGGPVAKLLRIGDVFGRVLLAYAALASSGLFCCVCAFRCRRGAWRPASYAALIAAALLAASYFLLPAPSVL